MCSTEPPRLFLRDAVAVFQGGGLRGAAHVGAVDALERGGVRFCAAAGSSAGALVATFVAAGMRAGELRRTLRGLDPTVLLGDSRTARAFLRALDSRFVFVRRARMARLLAARYRYGGLLDTTGLEHFISLELRRHLLLDREVLFGPTVSVSRRRHGSSLQPPRRLQLGAHARGPVRAPRTTTTGYGPASHEVLTAGLLSTSIGGSRLRQRPRRLAKRGALPAGMTPVSWWKSDPAGSIVDRLS
jgi:hypothetical protein